MIFNHKPNQTPHLNAGAKVQQFKTLTETFQPVSNFGDKPTKIRYWNIEHRAYRDGVVVGVHHSCCYVYVKTDVYGSTQPVGVVYFDGEVQ